MSYIYKITNDINEKVYVGKTNISLKERFQAHCKDAFKERNEQRPLYSAMRKYGCDHFHIDLIEQCDTSLASEREQYWIGYYQGYSDGYNATLGGDGKQLYDHEKIAHRLLECPYPIQIAQEFNCSVDLISIIAKEYQIPIKNLGQELNVNNKRSINQYTKQNKLIQTFVSISKAVNWLYQNKIIPNASSGARSHISEVASGKRKSAYGYLWRYAE